MTVDIKIKLLSPWGRLPAKNNRSDAGWDIYSAENVVIKTGKKVVVHTQIASRIPKEYFVSFRDRSGLAAKYGLHILAGVIDCDYTGEWLVVIANLGEGDYEIKKGDRIAQAVLHKVYDVNLSETRVLKDTLRGQKGFGSSGK